MEIHKEQEDWLDDIEICSRYFPSWKIPPRPSVYFGKEGKATISHRQHVNNIKYRKLNERKFYEKHYFQCQEMHYFLRHLFWYKYKNLIVTQFLSKFLICYYYTMILSNAPAKTLKLQNKPHWLSEGFYLKIWDGYLKW